MSAEGWKIMAGILHGYGECFWEENASGVVRRISRLLSTDQGQIILVKAIIGGLFIGFEEIEGSGIIVFSRSTTEEQQRNFKALWSNIAMPSNGPSRFRLEK